MSRLTAFALSCACIAVSASGVEEKEARVTGSLKESELARVELTPAAEKRLGIVTVGVERRRVPRSRLFGAVVVVPTVTSGEQSIYSVLPEMSPSEQVRIAEAQIEADGKVREAEVLLAAAEQTAGRSEVLLRDRVGSEKAVEEAKAAREVARQTLTTAKAKRALLGSPLLPSKAPAQVWVKVPVYAGMLDEMLLDHKAAISDPADTPGARLREAMPVSAPPSAQALTSTVDLFYALDNADRSLIPGQRVGARIARKGNAEAVAVPWSSVVYDINGGAWVYQKTGEHVFARRRVQVERVQDGLAILASGPELGALVVIEGAAELFGTEFGVPK